MIPYIFILLQLTFAIYLIFYIVAFLSGAPFVPSTNSTAAKMVELSKVSGGKVAYDLGSGEGKLLQLIARTGAKAI